MPFWEEARESGGREAFVPSKVLLPLALPLSVSINNVGTEPFQEAVPCLHLLPLHPGPSGHVSPLTLRRVKPLGWAELKALGPARSPLLGTGLSLVVGTHLGVTEKVNHV